MLRLLSSLCLIALATLPARAAPAPPCLAGAYDGGATEIAAGLELLADGRFRYGLSYGALDEQAEGRWEGDGAQITLIGDPVSPPRFGLVGEGGAPDGEFRALLDLPAGMDRQWFDIRLILADGAPIDRQLGEDGLILDLPPGSRVIQAQLRLDLFGIVSEPFPLSGREARFSFEPNDLGKANFVGTPLARDGADLLLERHGRLLRFAPVSGGCGR